MGGNQWDALRASHLLALKKPLSSVLVPEEGVEPSCPKDTASSTLPVYLFQHPGLTFFITVNLVYSKDFLRLSKLSFKAREILAIIHSFT